MPSPFLSLGTALGGFTNGYQQAQQNALKQQLGQIQIANAIQTLRHQQQQQQLQQQAGPVAWNALQQLGGGQGGQNPYAGLAGIDGGGTQAVTPPTPQINFVQPPMQQASVPSYSDSSQDNTTPPPPSGNLSPTQSAVATLVSQNQPVPADESPTSPGTGYTYDRNTYQWMPPAQSQGGSASGNLAQGGALSLGNVLDTISRDESGNRNILQTAYSGGPGAINPSTGTHTAPSSASGLYQITDQTWRGWAPKVGVDLRQYPTAMSAPPAIQRKVAAYGLQSEGLKPWAPYNPKLARDLGAGGGQTNPVVHIQQAGGKTAADAASMLPQQLFGQISLQTAVKAIDKANPDASPLVKFTALQELLKIMNPEDRMQTQMMLLQNRQEFQTALEMQREQFRDQEQNQRLEASQQNQGWTIGQVKDAQGNPVPVRINSRTGEVQPVQLPQGTTSLTHIGGANSSGGLPPGWDQSKIDFWANVVKNGGQLPPGIARTSGGSAIVQAIMNRIPGASGDAGSFIENHATVKADTSSLNNLTKTTDAAESFEKTANKNFDNALSLAKDAIPTDSGPWLNKWVETGQTQFGDENVPPYTAALLTAANEYAKIMSGSTGSQGSTVDSRREAAELFSPYLNNGQIARVVAIAKQDMANRNASLYGRIDEVKQRLKTAGSNKPTAEQGAPPASAAPTGGIPVPAGHENDPDGKRYQGSDGKIYVKQGNMAVPQ